MAVGKKSVLLYCDIIHTVEKLDDNTAGKLFKHYLRYVNDLNPVADDVIIDLLFEQIKQQLKRDLQKWEAKQGDRSLNGRMGNLKRYNPDLYELVISDKMKIEEAENIAKSRKASHSDNSDRIPSQEVANVAVTDNVNVTVNVKDIDSNTILSVKPDVKVSKKVVYNTDVDSIYNAYPSKCPINNRSTGKTAKNKDKIKSLLQTEGFELLQKSIEYYLEDCKRSKTYLKNFGTFLNNLPDKDIVFNYFKNPVQEQKKSYKISM